MSYSLSHVLILARSYRALYSCSNHDAAYLAVTHVRGLK